MIHDTEQFNLVWRHARRADLLGPTIDETTRCAFTRRLLIGPVFYTLRVALGILLPVFGMVAFAAPTAVFWLPLGRRSTGTL